MRFLPERLAPLLILIALVLSGTTAGAQDVKRYAVKFICGTADGKVLSTGQYTTAINIGNPNQDPDSAAVTLRKRFAVALPGEISGGVTDFLDANKLAPGEAYEIDCPDIRAAIRRLCPNALCKGFVTIESSADLEIVAVYSAGDASTANVQALHTERVTPAGRCPVRTEQVPGQTILFVPPNVRGDREFDGHGPCVTFSLDLRTQDQGTTLLADYTMQAFECEGDFAKPKNDFTASEGERQTILLAAGPGSRILGYDVTSSMQPGLHRHQSRRRRFQLSRERSRGGAALHRRHRRGRVRDQDRSEIELRPVNVTLEDCSVQ